VETDGLAAVSWAKDRKVSLEELPELLRQSVEAIAKEKRRSVSEVEQILADNVIRFLFGE
jgi:Tat protein secretion system quality control protein TatD with DNase activity